MLQFNLLILQMRILAKTNLFILFLRRNVKIEFHTTLNPIGPCDVLYSTLKMGQGRKLQTDPSLGFFIGDLCCCRVQILFHCSRNFHFNIKITEFGMWYTLQLQPWKMCLKKIS